MAEKSTVLVVDDTPDNLVLLNGILRHEFTVKLANDGHTALQIAAEAPPPDLILLDIMMPEIDGYAVCRKLKENGATRNIPILFVSALTETFDIVKAFEAGGVDYVTKPFQPSEIIARVKTHLELYNTRRELQMLLSKTLTGSIKMLIDLLSLTQPELMEQSNRIRRYLRELIPLLTISPEAAWGMELAAMLFPVGCVGIEQDLLHKRHIGQCLSQEEMHCLEDHIGAGADMIGRIPRMEKVAAMIRNQNTALYQPVEGESDITALGSVILHMLLTFDALVASGKKPLSALATLQEQPYPLHLLEGLKKIVANENKRKPEMLSCGLLQPGMVLAADLLDENDRLIMANGSELSVNLIRLLRNYAENGRLSCQNVLVWEGVSS